MTEPRNVVISPHLDDAVVSLGGYLAGKESVVVTVFAGIPADDVLTDYDRSCGFDTSAQAMHERRVEDDEACGTLGAHSAYLPFFDRQYDRPAPDDALQHALTEFVVVEGWPLFAPVGIGHPDHVRVARAVRETVEPGDHVLLYEELPYRVMWPEQVCEALDLVRSEGFHVEPFELLPGDLKRKARAVECYRSQQFPEWTCMLPERVWRATRT